MSSNLTFPGSHRACSPTCFCLNTLPLGLVRYPALFCRPPEELASGPWQMGTFHTWSRSAPCPKACQPSPYHGPWFTVTAGSHSPDRVCHLSFRDCCAWGEVKGCSGTCNWGVSSDRLATTYRFEATLRVLRVKLSLGVGAKDPVIKAKCPAVQRGSGRPQQPCFQVL